MKREQLTVTETIDEIQDALRCLERSGWDGFDCSSRCLETIQNWGRPPGAVRESLNDIQRDLGECRRCGLSAGRTKIVFGAGNPEAELVFIGEGPGYEEDRQGEPFVGPAGQLLTKIIAAIGLDRDQVYICNIIKCRPPGNRNPETDEIATCSPFLKRQLKAIRPKFVCTLGKFAAQTLLDTTDPISRLRGHRHFYDGLRVIPTYHPAYLLRNPGKKRQVWEDMKLLMKEMGLPLPAKDASINKT